MENIFCSFHNPTHTPFHTSPKNDKTPNERRSACSKNRNLVKVDDFVKHVDPTAPRTIGHKISHIETILDSIFYILQKFGEPFFNSLMLFITCIFL
jgi:hypothetical protein